MQIDFQIKADGQDLTALLKDRLTRLSITDEAGFKSDAAEITIDDRDHRVTLPPTGALLEISIGFKETGLVSMGKYTVDEFEGEEFPATLTIRAKAADMIKGLKARKTRAWQWKTLDEIVKKVASEHGLKPSVSGSLKSRFYKYLAQTSESDLNFLTRLAKNLDATCKPAGGYLLFKKNGDGKATDGQEIPVFTLHRSEMTTCTWTVTSRARYGKVIAQWSDIGSGTVHKVSAGTKEPVLTLRHRFHTKPEAEDAAKSALERSSRGSGTINVTLAGFHGELLAEGFVELEGIKPGLTGRWLIKRVQHDLAGALVTSFEAERDNEKEDE